MALQKTTGVLVKEAGLEEKKKDVLEHPTETEIMQISMGYRREGERGEGERDRQISGAWKTRSHSRNRKNCQIHHGT